MTAARIGLAIAVVVTALGGGHPASAQPAEPRERTDGYIGKEVPDLEIDDCPAIDPALTQPQLLQRAAERYSRGETLYIQGDYDGAVTEFVSAYCGIEAKDRTAFYSILKDIGQAYERSLEYEKAIGYLERFVIAVPADAKRASACAPDPQIDKENVRRRIEVLQKLQARIFVQTAPAGATVTIQNDGGIAARGSSGEEIEVVGGRYEMIVEREGHETERRRIDVRIGKPYTFFFAMRPLEGRLSIQVTPADARVFIDKRFVGVGRVDESLPSKVYELLIEAPGRIEQTRDVEVLPNQQNRLSFALEPKPQFGRRQLIVYTTIGGAVSTGAMLYAFEDAATTAIGVLGGAGAGFLGGYLYFSDNVTLGTSNLAITSSVAAGIAGAYTASVFSDDPAIVVPTMGASLVAGGGLGYYLGRRTQVTPGDAALINTSIIWGTAAGSLLTQSFAADRRVSAGLVLSGLGLGTVSGVLMTQYFSVSRKRAILIDIGAAVGIIAGLATVNLAYGAEEDSESNDEHRANFSLGGMIVGLVTAGVLTRNMDAPKIPLTPALGRTTDAAGGQATIYGFSGAW